MEEKRDKTVLIKFTQQELDLVERNMQHLNIQNRSGFVRKMAIDGYFLTLEIPELKEISRLFGIASNNINQIAKVANSTANIALDDVLEVQATLDSIKIQFGEILSKLSKL